MKNTQRRLGLRCYSCSNISFNILCKSCKEGLFKPQIQTQKVGTMDVISFYRYASIGSLLHSKHKPQGHRIYTSLAVMTLKPFMQEFVENNDGEVYIVGVDEHVKSGYAHVSLLLKAMEMPTVIPQYASLLAKNRVNYSGKSLEFRLKNPRDFVYTGKEDVHAILVDDIMTTGITLQEAQKVLMEHGVNVLFALTLADVEL